MDRYEGPLTSLILALIVCHSLARIMDPYEGPLTALTIALNGGL
jgi:hypothetical protein